MQTAARRLGGSSDTEELLDAIDRFLRATGETTEWPRLSESDYVDRILRFANAPYDEHAEELVDIWFELVLGTALTEDERGGGSENSADLVETQAKLIEWLEIVRTGRPHAVQKLKGLVSEAGKRMIIRPAFVEQDGKFRAEYRYFPNDIEAAFGYGLLLLLDEQRGLGFFRCKYSECHRYFRETEPENGRPRRVYCSSEHLDAARRAEGAERMRRRRNALRQSTNKTRRRQK